MARLLLYTVSNLASLRRLCVMTKISLFQADWSRVIVCSEKTGVLLDDLVDLKLKSNPIQAKSNVSYEFYLLQQKTIKTFKAIIANYPWNQSNCL